MPEGGFESKKKAKFEEPTELKEEVEKKKPIGKGNAVAGSSRKRKEEGDQGGSTRSRGESKAEVKIEESSVAAARPSTTKRQKKEEEEEVRVPQRGTSGERGISKGEMDWMVEGVDWDDVPRSSQVGMNY